KLSLVAIRSVPPITLPTTSVAGSPDACGLVSMRKNLLPAFAHGNLVGGDPARLSYRSQFGGRGIHRKPGRAEGFGSLCPSIAVRDLAGEWRDGPFGEKLWRCEQSFSVPAAWAAPQLGTWRVSRTSSSCAWSIATRQPSQAPSRSCLARSSSACVA